ncbi:Uncharacterised protein [Mycobacteroides abscessus subsp. abscessus]|nr:Uncharacterised protein [Mycobacteroides abscessus subsp. abscessus]
MPSTGRGWPGCRRPRCIACWDRAPTRRPDLSIIAETGCRMT